MEYSKIAEKKNDDNSKFIKCAKLLGLETEYFSGMFKVRINGEFIGQMSSEAWLDHLRNCMIKAKRC